MNITDIKNINTAVSLLRAGKLVAFPTETVYGLGADARNEQAVREIFRIKERPFNHPLIVHLAEPNQLAEWTKDVSAEALLLAKTYWPGPLTLILKKHPSVLSIVTGGQDTIGVRIPHHPVAQALLQAFGSGIAAPSANKFTHVSPTTAADVYDELGDEVSLILDGGACTIGLESTIIDMSSDVPMILRPGMISAEVIAKTLGREVLLKRKNTKAPLAPGQHHLHYAPLTKTILLQTNVVAEYLKHLLPPNLPVAVMTLSSPILPVSDKFYRVKMPNNAKDYAHHLYHTLRELDHQHFKQIIIEAVPDDSEWEAIRDRIAKATNRKAS